MIELRKRREAVNETNILSKIERLWLIHESRVMKSVKSKPINPVNTDSEALIHDQNRFRNFLASELYDPNFDHLPHGGDVHPMCFSSEYQCHRAKL